MTVKKDQTKLVLIDEVIAKLRHFVNLYGINSLFLVGGYCRDTLIGNPEDVKDLDVASAFHEQAIQLGGLFASEILHTTPEFYHRSGAAMVTYNSDFGSIKIEFQGQSTNSYMYNQEIRDWMHQNNIDDVPLLNNIYGRDFTINTIIYSIKKDAFYDITQKAEEDLKDKKIRSVLPPNLLVKNNPLAILRAIRFALQYDFVIDPDLRVEMTNKSNLLRKQLSEDRILKEIVRILKINGPEGLKMLQKYNLDEFLFHPEIKSHL